MEDQEIAWGLVVESDQVYSARTDRWYEITQVVTDGSDVKVRMAGISKQIIKSKEEKVRVRRGPTGKAVDVFIEVMYSGPGVK